MECLGEWVVSMSRHRIPDMVKESVLGREPSEDSATSVFPPKNRRTTFAGGQKWLDRGREQRPRWKSMQLRKLQESSVPVQGNPFYELVKKLDSPKRSLSLHTDQIPQG